MTLTITETEHPKGSKAGGRISIGTIHAQPTPQEIPAAHGHVVIVTGNSSYSPPGAHGGVDYTYKTWKIRATGNPDDTVTLSIGSPQPVTATIAGAVVIDE